MDLVWMIARELSTKLGWTFDGDAPSDIEYDTKRRDTRSAEQIKKGLLDALGEG